MAMSCFLPTERDILEAQRRLDDLVGSNGFTLLWALNRRRAAADFPQRSWAKNCPRHPHCRNLAHHPRDNHGYR